MKKTRRQFLVTTGSTLAAGSVRGANKKESPLFTFGLMADCQYVDAETRGTRFYRNSPRKLEEAVTALNQHDLAFTFHLGDFIDREYRSFDVLEPVAKKLESKLYHALGNHDFDVEDEKKAEVPGRLGLQTGYYSFQKEGFRFVVIDTTEVSTYRHSKGASETLAAAEELKKVKAEGIKGAQPWNGRPGEDQVQWIREQLDAAEKAGETVLILGHHPILPDESHAIWNASEVRRLFQENTCAKLYLNGHNHAGAYVDASGLHFLTLDGMVETENTNAFAVAHLYRDRIEIAGSGRQESYALKFR